MNFPHVFITLIQENPEIFSPLGLKKPELWPTKLIGWLSTSVGFFFGKMLTNHKHKLENKFWSSGYIGKSPDNRSLQLVFRKNPGNIRKMGKCIFGKIAITHFPPFFFWNFFFKIFYNRNPIKLSKKNFLFRPLRIDFSLF